MVELCLLSVHGCFLPRGRRLLAYAFVYLCFSCLLLGGKREKLAIVMAHDYTEGASVLDIRDAVARTFQGRRDPDLEEGEGFAGPRSVVVPTTTSRMSYADGRSSRRPSAEWSRTRRRSDGAVSERSAVKSRDRRRMSADSRASLISDTHEDDDDGEETSSVQGRHAKQSASNRPSVFDNIAHLFNRAAPGQPTKRRGSRSQRSSVSSTRRSERGGLSDSGSVFETEDEAVERWGYSSGEEAESVESPSSRPPSSLVSDVEYGSRPPSPSGRSTHLPLLALDPIFGDEVRIDMNVPLEPLHPPPPGPPSRQKIYIADEDSTLLFVGYEIIVWRQKLWRASCFLTLGLFGLLGHWFPRVWLRWVVRERAFKHLQNGFVVIEVCPVDLASFSIADLSSLHTRILHYFQSSILHTHTNVLLSSPILQRRQCGSHRCFRSMTMTTINPTSSVTFSLWTIVIHVSS